MKLIAENCIKKIGAARTLTNANDEIPAKILAQRKIKVVNFFHCIYLLNSKKS